MREHDHSPERTGDGQAPTSHHHRAETSDDVETRLLRGFAGLLGAVGAFGGALIPLPISSGLMGENYGASLGCGASALIQLAILMAIARYPGTPGAHVIYAMCSKMIVLMTVFAPVGAAIELLDDRGRAVMVGVIVGAVLLAAGLLAIRALPQPWRPGGYRASALYAASSAGAAAGMAVHHDRPGDPGGVDGSSPL